MALTSLVFIVPMVLLLAAAAPAADQGASSIGFPFAMMLFMPVIYLITTYIAVALGSVLYNFLVRYIGGIEYEAEQEG